MTVQTSLFQTETLRGTIFSSYRLKQSIAIDAIPTYEIAYKPGNGYGVYVAQDAEENEFTFCGNFVSRIMVGQSYHMVGYIVEYREEKQLFVKYIQNITPVGKRGIVSYMMSLRGLKSKANAIFERYGTKSIQMLMNNPETVAKEIRGIGKKSVESWKTQLECMRDTRDVTLKLLDFGLTNQQAHKLYEQYKDDVVEKIQKNPYCLAKEVRGYSFLTCDKIARQIGTDPESEFRIQEALVFLLESAETEGHCYLPISELVGRAEALLEIKFGAEEMIKQIKLHRGEKEFPVYYSDREYNISVEDLEKKYEEYRAAKPNRRKSIAFVVARIDSKKILEQLLFLCRINRLVNDDEKIYRKRTYEDECECAKLVFALLDSERNFASGSADLEKTLNSYLEKHKITLETRQREAILRFAQKKGGFFILNGSAGCGKTFTLKIIVEMLKHQYDRNMEELKIAVYAPTGKASKVASRATGFDCKTIHRGLEYRPPEGFVHNSTNPLEYNCIIVDETSMLDISLARSLFEAIKVGTKVIFIGDTKQLPSVGAGNVLHDLIDSNAITVVTLDVVKRQGENSGIIYNANNIIHGVSVETRESTGDAYVILKDDTVSAQKTMISSVKKLLFSKRFSFEEIQVLCLQKTGIIGTNSMNYVLQREFNHNPLTIKIPCAKFNMADPDSGDINIIQLYFKKGDKVIHTKNNYNINWYNSDGSEYVLNKTVSGVTNGECGIIEDIVYVKTPKKNIARIVVKYDGGYVFYDDKFDELELSYALTIHKSQGSQWKSVIIPIMFANYMMLDNNLFYTALTRASEFVAVVGQQKAIDMAIKTHKSRERYTYLGERIQKIA